MPDPTPNPTPSLATGVLVLSDGTVIRGQGLGAKGAVVGELCFNTAMTGYQEVLTDPSYAAQIIVFTFPHIGNVGANTEDLESATPMVRGCVLRADITVPANWRAQDHLDRWLAKNNVIALAGVDTRALTKLLRERGFINAVIAHDPDGAFDFDALAAKARDWPGLVGMDLAREVTTRQTYQWTEGLWDIRAGYQPIEKPRYRVVAIDYGIKRNILRCLASVGCEVTVVPADATAEDVLRHEPDGVFLSNGPGDPAATGEYAVPVIRKLIDTGLPVFGICLGHQMLGLALGAKTVKMHQGHHGANHPVKDFTTGKVEITSMNHGFAVDRASLPQGVTETHVSLFDGSNCGIALEGKPVFSVQHHPEASPGPQDSHYLFQRFAQMMEAKR
jgi:carbamoyl-phosphate synthase small subunit